MMMDLISLNTTLLLDHNWFDDLTTHSYIHTLCSASCTTAQSYVEVSPPKPSGSSDDCLPLQPVISCELLELISKFCSNNGKRKIFIRPEMPSYSSAAAAQRETSLFTSTTSNPCRADWPVNCCNLKSRAPIADRSVTMCVTILKGGSNLKSSCCLNRIPIKISLARFSIR